MLKVTDGMVTKQKMIVLTVLTAAHNTCSVNPAGKCDYEMMVRHANMNTRQAKVRGAVQPTITASIVGILI
jgi:hypothetical protein